jgi:sortase (surface protein transpeptidase)
MTPGAVSWAVSPRIVFLAVLVSVSTTALAGSQASATVSTGDGPTTVMTAPSADSFRSVRSYPRVAVPVRLRIPSLRVDTPLQGLGRAADQTIEVPTDFGVAGWFADGPRPGQAGPAVILGHADSATGPGVFLRLPELAPGADVQVDRADGSSVDFRVTAVRRVAKAGFPTEEVYGPTLDPSLRLVTCGGQFDRTRSSYHDNVIVYAEPAG